MRTMPVKELLEIALDAGSKIMGVYSTEFEVEQKDDKSPLTKADKLAHASIIKGLEQMDSTIPILSEEGLMPTYEERKTWKTFWLIDPLDGTKEFIKKNDEFTVNIAYIENGLPKYGVIYAPALDIYYFGAVEIGAFKLENASKTKCIDSESLMAASKKIEVAPIVGETVCVVASRSHLSEETKEFIEELNNRYTHVEVTSAGSSLKFCLVAEGLAHFYPRYAPTMEWDTAAGQAIVEAAGGEVIDYVTKQSKTYNQRDILNNWFMVK